MLVRGHTQGSICFYHYLTPLPYSFLSQRWLRDCLDVFSLAERRRTSELRVRVTLVLPTPLEWRNLMTELHKKGAEGHSTAIQKTWNDRALFWNVSLSRKAFLMLRNVVCMEYTPDHSAGGDSLIRRKRLRGPLGVKYPSPPLAEHILSKTRANDCGFNLLHPLNVYAFPDQEQWKMYDPDGEVPEGAEFRGCIFHPIDVFAKFGLELATLPFRPDLELRTLSLFIWSDGGRVDTNKVFSILRLVDHHPDPSERLFPNYASVRGFWFQLLAREKDLKYVTELRVEHLQWIEARIWTMLKTDKTKVYVRVETRFLSGDNKLLWMEAGIGGVHYRCTHCACPVNHSDWMSFKPVDSRTAQPYAKRTLGYQVTAGALQEDGVSAVPPLSPLAERHTSIFFTCAIMHNIRGVLRVLRRFLFVAWCQTAQLTTFQELFDLLFRCVERLGSDTRPLRRKEVQRQLTSVVERKFSFSQPQFARHYRELFAEYETILFPFLPSQLLRFLSYLAACISWLTYSSTVMNGSAKDRARSVLRYRVMAFLLIQGARIVVKHKGWDSRSTCPHFNSIYSHTLLNHMADQLETFGTLIA